MHKAFDSADWRIAAIGQALISFALQFTSHKALYFDYFFHVCFEEGFLLNKFPPYHHTAHSGLKLGYSWFDVF